MRTTNKRGGFTLIETMIVVAIMGFIMTIALSAMTSMSSVSAMGAAQDELVIDSNRIIAEVGSDMSASGWYFSTATGSAGAPYSGISFADDRSKWYFPYVLQQVAETTNSNGGFPTATAFAPLARTTAYKSFSASQTAGMSGLLKGSPADADAAPGALGAPTYANSYFARSQELVFLRATVNSWNESYQIPLTTSHALPNQIQKPILHFPGTANDWKQQDNHSLLQVLQASGWYESSLGASDWTRRTTGSAYGKVMDGARLDLNAASGTISVALQWEENGNPSFQAQNDADLRMFTYAVVPTPNGTGIGRLVRAFVRTQTSAPVMGTEPGQAIAYASNMAVIVDSVLSNNVTRVVFDTARHDAALEVNQVRMRVYLAKQVIGTQDLIVSSLVETTFAMRAKNNNADQGLDTANIGMPLPFTYE